MPPTAHQATTVGFFFSEVPGSSLTVICVRRGAAATWARVGGCGVAHPAVVRTRPYLPSIVQQPQAHLNQLTFWPVYG